MKTTAIHITLIASLVVSSYAHVALAQTKQGKIILQEKINEQKENAQQGREAIKQRMQAAQEAAKTKREATTKKLKAKLTSIKDERKKETVERLDARFTEINEKFTLHLGESLDRLEDLLQKVSSRADKAAANGRDVALVRTTIETAKTEITKARTAAETQLTKTYPIAVTNEAQLKSAVATTRTSLNKDLKTLKETVQKAHKAVVDATKMLKNIPQVDELKIPEASTTPSTTTPSSTQ
ncbi:MAG: hypothetical protein HZA36_03730 [Parcubacteria group bacterium]|nr:hypothetical protein [Parcubacteria group bacterium]